ncbi:hypothetical protein ABID59_005672 [Bradyrhizobium sp. S3.3.6]|uniref:hypothetical protein n=1 Tax=Bradyrhizobium sp. S3.3.6 TaxID=3156429 RepID=UPI003392486A
MIAACPRPLGQTEQSARVVAIDLLSIGSADFTAVKPAGSVLEAFRTRVILNMDIWSNSTSF